jgi:hypothetical protein
VAPEILAVLPIFFAAAQQSGFFARWSGAGYRENVPNSASVRMSDIEFLTAGRTGS